MNQIDSRKISTVEQAEQRVSDVAEELRALFDYKYEIKTNSRDLYVYATEREFISYTLIEQLAIRGLTINGVCKRNGRIAVYAYQYFSEYD